MPYSAVCQNCRKQNEPYMDPKTDKVYCGLCDIEMSANHFVKVQMKTLKQFKEKSMKPFAVKCQYCNKEEQPDIVKNEVICPNCKKPHKHLSEPFRLMLKNNLLKFKKDIE